MHIADFVRSDTRSPQAHPLADMIRTVVLDADRLSPRSQQVAAGPSEIGEPCARRLTYKIMNQPPSNKDSDPWAAIVGTATHAWLAEAFTAANTRLGRTRYLVEKRLQIVPGLTGACDLYDIDVATVIDHKVLGPSSMAKYKNGPPPPYYHAQAHLYGMGYAALGLPVRTVALAYYPRGGTLAGLHVWSEPYDQRIADAALARYWRIVEVAVTLDVEHQPEMYKAIPRETGHRCTWCPWWKPGADTGATCPGHLDSAA